VQAVGDVKRVLALGCLLLASLALQAGSALAATPLGQTVGSMFCSQPQTLFQTTSPGINYSAPSPGVITSWSYQAPAAADIRPIELKAARSAGVNDLTIVGESERVTPTTPLAVNTFPTQVPVQAGDVIGLYLPNAGRCGVSNPDFAIHRILDGVDRPPGDTSTYTAADNVQVNVAATLEPDCDSDGFGDETQDADVSVCSPKADRTLTLDANKGKVEKGRKVRLTGQIDAPQNEAGCEPNQTVELQRKAKKQPDTAFSTFDSVQTDATGNFADKVKVKKTRIYRAHVQETEVCDDELSNTQKVRVQKPSAAKEA
jgi:hypothetical protein